ncbi:MAG: hypothetical protein ACUVTL_01875 [Thermoproteota archaeon]
MPSRRYIRAIYDITIDGVVASDPRSSSTIDPLEVGSMAEEVDHSIS